MFEIADPESVSHLAGDCRSLTSNTDLDLSISTLQLQAAVKADTAKRIEPITGNINTVISHLSTKP